jgi:SpoIID/LytB domain protein
VGQRRVTALATVVGVSLLVAPQLAAGAAVGAAAPPQVPPIAQAPASGTFPPDTTTVRIAMTENDTGTVRVSSSVGVAAPGVANAAAVRFVPAAGGVWTVSTSSGCTGPWTPVTGTPVATPVAQPAGTGELTLCADNGTRLAVQGTVEALYNSAGQARTVNTLPLEAYVADVVPGESSSGWGTIGAAGPQGRPWGFQELEAQAVAVRSYVLASRSDGGWGGYATTCDLTCQWYRGTRYLSANSEAAAKDTAGAVMVMPSGAIATTEYSASTGGYTSSSAEGSPFDPVPDTGDVVCLTPTNGDLCNPSHDWTVTVPLSQVHSHWAAEGTTPTVTISGRNGDGTWGGRVTQVTISGNGTSQVVPAYTFTVALTLKSNYFTITSQPGQALHITGHGWGHGIGMGQWGAFGYAVGTDNGQGNWTWERIVEHYYAPSTIGSLPGSTTSTFTTFTRIYGTTADETAVKELETRFVPGTRCPGATSGTRPVVLATDGSYPDALASAPLARALATGTLLTPTATLSSATLAALQVEGITRVDVVGGPLAVSQAVVTQLEHTTAYACGGGTKLDADIRVTWIYGQTAYDTAAAIAGKAAAAGVGTVDLAGAYAGLNATGGRGRYNDTSGTASTGPSASGALRTAVLATGQGFQDATAASTLAYADRLPVLLTAPSSLSRQAATAIASLHVQQVILMGGPLAVSDAVVSTLIARGVSVVRVAGTDYTDTAAQLALLETSTAPTGAGWRGTGDLTVARGDFFTDALAGAVVAAAGPTSVAPEPLLLTTSPTTVGSSLQAFVHTAGTTGVGGTKVTHFTVLGGPLALTTAAITELGNDL